MCSRNSQTARPPFDLQREFICFDLALKTERRPSSSESAFHASSHRDLQPATRDKLNY